MVSDARGTRGRGIVCRLIFDAVQGGVVPRSDMNLCEACKKEEGNPGERFCKTCRKELLKKLRDDGYLESGGHGHASLPNGMKRIVDSYDSRMRRAKGGCPHEANYGEESFP